MDEKDKEIARLKKLLEGQEESAKMLVRRDLELTRAYEKLEDLGKMKSDFVSVVAHQLRTPLSVTKWALDMLYDISQNSLTPEQVQVLMQGKESNERMIALVDNLLKVDLHEIGKMQYSFETISIHSVVDPVVDQLMVIAKQRNIDLQKIYDANNTNIYADKERLQSVLQNFLENALKYTPKGGEVIVTIKSNDTDIEVSVKDNGIGIPENELDKLFTKFYRGENAIKTVTEGSGLGLFIAKKIIKRHGGKIWAKSNEGKGSTFYFSIPIKESE